MSRILEIAVAVVLAAAAPAAALAAQRCTITAKFACNADGCAPYAITLWHLFDPATGQYRRCDDKGCDSFDATVTRAGLFTVVELPGLGTVAKINDTTGAFTEVTTVLNSVLVSFGMCAAEDGGAAVAPPGSLLP